MESESQKRARKNYEAKTKMTVLLKLNKNTDSDIIGFLETLENKNGFIKDLIRREINK